MSQEYKIRATDMRRLKGAALVLKEDTAALYAAIAGRRETVLLTRLHDAAEASLKNLTSALFQAVKASMKGEEEASTRPDPNKT